MYRKEIEKYVSFTKTLGAFIPLIIFYTLAVFKSNSAKLYCICVSTALLFCYIVFFSNKYRGIIGTRGPSNVLGSPPQRNYIFDEKKWLKEIVIETEKRRINEMKSERISK